MRIISRWLPVAIILIIISMLVTVAHADSVPLTGYKVPMVYTLIGNQRALDIISAWPDGYIQDRDIIMITKPLFQVSDADAVNTLAVNIHARFPNVKIGVRTFGLEYMKHLRDAPLSEDITILSYVYEDRKNFGDEPEFSPRFTDTVITYYRLSVYMRPWTNQEGKELWTEPTGRGLPHRDYVDWNYAIIGDLVDVVSIQSQHNAEEELDGSDPNSYRDALAQVSSDMAAAGITQWYMQLSLGNEVNGIPGQAGYDQIFEALQVPTNTPGLNLWVAYNSQLTEGRIFMDNWAPMREIVE